MIELTNLQYKTAIEKEIDDIIVKLKIDKIEGEIITERNRSIPIRISVVDLVPSSSLFPSLLILRRYKFDTLPD